MFTETVVKCLLNVLFSYCVTIICVLSTTNYMMTS